MVGQSVPRIDGYSDALGVLWCTPKPALSGGRFCNPILSC